MPRNTRKVPPNQGGLKRAMGGSVRNPLNRSTPVKGNHLMRNSRFVRGSNSRVLPESDNALAESGEGLRKVMGRVASRGRIAAAKGGKVDSAMSALQSLAKKYRQALDMDDTEAATRIKRQMERLKRGSTKEADAEEEVIGEEKAATFAKGGKVAKLAMTLKTAIAEARKHGTHLRKVENEYQIKPQNKSWSSDSVYYTDDLDDAVGTAKLINKPKEE